MPGLTDILDELENDTSGDSIQLGDVVSAFENRGFGPLLLAPALIALLPSGAIPGVPAVCAALIVLISVQMLRGREHPWLPDRLKSMSLSRDKYLSAAEKARPWTRRIDRLVTSRLEGLTGSTATRVVGVIAILLAAVMVPLEVVPFACAIPAGSLAFLALGLSARDGLVILLGFLSTTASFWAVIKWLG